MADIVYAQIADSLRQRIETGDLRPGDSVPTETELAREWNTSRGPVRNALAQLRNEGRIDTGRGRPARVVEHKTEQPLDVPTPFTRWATHIGAKPGADTQELSIRRASRENAALLDIAEGQHIVEVLRLRLLDGAPTMLERLSYVEDVGRLLFDTNLDDVSITEYLESRGVRISSVDHEIDAVAADEVDSELLDVDEGWPILRLRRISRDQTGRVIEASDDRYRSDIVRFTVATSGKSTRDDGYVRPLGATR